MYSLSRTQDRLYRIGGAAISPASVPVLTLTCFGCFSATINGVTVLEREYQYHSKDLLALLAMRPHRAWQKEEIMDALFPESDGDRASRYVDNAVSGLRVLLRNKSGGHDGYLIRERQTYRLSSDYVRSDYEQFLTLIRQAERAADLDEKASKALEAIDLYQDALLLDQPNAEWAVRPRENARLMANWAASILQAAGLEQQSMRRHRLTLALLRHLDTQLLAERNARIVERYHMAWAARAWRSLAS